MQASQLKVVLSVAILVAGLSLTVACITSETTEPGSGVVIDFGDRETSYTEVDVSEHSDPLSILDFACHYHGYELVTDGDEVVSIDGRSDGRWAFYGVPIGSTEWSEIGDASFFEADGYIILCWALSDDSTLPSPAVDSTGVCFYGQGIPTRVVSLAPSCTETIAAAGGLDSIVATDQYSNYPSEIVDLRNSGKISTVGGFTNPSYEMILKASPDLVVCIDSQNAHVQTAEKLRQHGINVLVISGGEERDILMDNIFMVGVVMGTQDSTNITIDTIEGQIDQVEEIVEDGDNVWDKRVMVALSAVKSPWVSGSDTYISDVMSGIRLVNIYSSESGWVQVNAETILQYDPEYIIIVSSDYKATQSNYDSMLASMSTEWKATSAYKSGNIYLFCDDACDLVSRPGPRVAQITELFARTMQGSAFDDGITVSKFVGDEYRDYLTISKEGSI